MEEATLEYLMSEAHNLKSQFIQEQYQHSEPKYRLKATQAITIEHEFNRYGAILDSPEERVMLMPVRSKSQTLTMKGMPERPKRTFEKDELQNLIDYYQMLDLVKPDPRRKKNLHLFLTLEQLKRHHLSKYFLALPDPIHLKLYDYREVIRRPLDLRIIANKLVRGKYKDRREFEVDMVTMIQNHKIYFIGDVDMLEIAVRFQDLFWRIYEDEDKYLKADEIYRYLKKKCMPSRKGIKVNQKKSIRKELLEDINNLTQLSREKVHAVMIRDIFEGRRKNIEDLDIMSLKEEQFQKLKDIIRKVGVKQPQRRPMKKKEKEKSMLQLSYESEDRRHDLYFSDEEEEPKDNHDLAKKLGEVIDELDPGRFHDSDEDD